MTKKTKKRLQWIEDTQMYQRISGVKVDTFEALAREYDKIVK